MPLLFVLLFELVAVPREGPRYKKNLGYYTLRLEGGVVEAWLLGVPVVLVRCRDYSTGGLKTGRGGDLVLLLMTPALGTLGENHAGLSLLATGAIASRTSWESLACGTHPIRWHPSGPFPFFHDLDGRDPSCGQEHTVFGCLYTTTRLGKWKWPPLLLSNTVF